MGENVEKYVLKITSIYYTVWEKVLQPLRVAYERVDMKTSNLRQSS